MYLGGLLWALTILAAGCNPGNEDGTRSADRPPTESASIHAGENASPPAKTETWEVPFVIKDSTAVRELEGGVRMYVLEEGKGMVPNLMHHVLIHYHGTLEDGTVFDSSYEKGQPADFLLRDLIRGWQVALTKVRTGSRIKLIVPPEMGYGMQGNGPGVPPNATLIFDIDLISAY